MSCLWRPDMPLRTASLTTMALLAALATVVTNGAPAAAQTANMCTRISENPDWVGHLQAVEARWGVTPGTVMAILDQESRFNARAMGPGATGPAGQRNFGYAQANLRTWNWFLQDSGWNGSRSRSDFEASAHFIGWHFDEHVSLINAPVSDVYRHYLVFKQGLGGYRRGAPASSQRLARTIAGRAAAADRQLDGCGL
jgi:hypothetical protein